LHDTQEDIVKNLSQTAFVRAAAAAGAITALIAVVGAGKKW
jgi:hypothetical protein